MHCPTELELAKVKKILVCQLRQIGDVLLATPAIELLHKRFPQAEIHVFTEKKCTPMLANNPHIYRIWAVDKKKLSNLFKEIIFYREVAGQGFDLVVDFQQLPRCRWVVGFSKAPIRLSYTPPWYTRWLYTCWHKEQPKVYSAHKKASILEVLGIKWSGEPPRIYLTSEEQAEASAILKQSALGVGDKLITLDPTHCRVTRLWPARHYARLIDLAYEQDSSLRFLPLYGPGEEKDIEKLAALVKNKSALIMTPRMLTLRQAAACQARALAHLGNCSAPRHIATGVGTPTFTILGSTDIYWDYPSSRHPNMALGLDCQPCNQNECSKGIICLEQLLPEMVLERFMQFVNSINQENGAGQING